MRLSVKVISSSSELPCDEYKPLELSKKLGNLKGDSVVPAKDGDTYCPMLGANGSTARDRLQHQFIKCVCQLTQGTPRIRGDTLMPSIVLKGVGSLPCASGSQPAQLLRAVRIKWGVLSPATRRLPNALGLLLGVPKALILSSGVS